MCKVFNCKHFNTEKCKFDTCKECPYYSCKNCNHKDLRCNINDY